MIDMRDSDNEAPHPEKPTVSGKLRIEPWEAESLAHPQLKLFCDADFLQFLSPGTNPAPAHPQSKSEWSCKSSDMNAVIEDILSFREFGTDTKVTETAATTFAGENLLIPTYVNEFWTKQQKAAHSLHRISYHACFKPQLPRFLIRRLTQPGDTVYDPFMGRGTTLLEAALMGRTPIGCDINPLSIFLCRPRLNPPTLAMVARRLAEIDFTIVDEIPEDLLAFYHRETLKEICALRKYLLRRQANARAVGAAAHVGATEGGR